MKRVLSSFVAVVAGCGGGIMVDPAPPAAEGPPDLSGTYSLVSLTGVISRGVTVGPPIAVGTFTLSQNPSSGDTATGTMSLDGTFTNPLNGEVTAIRDSGTFTVRSDGSWGQVGGAGPASGTYSLAGTVLTVMVTEPAAAVSTTVWQRQ